MAHGIDVIVIGPGAVATSIWDKAEKVDISPYLNTEYSKALGSYSTYMTEGGRKGYPPEYIGKVVWKALTTSHPHTRYGYTVVPHPLVNWLMPRLLPRRRVDSVIAGNLGLKRR
jgi:hypothetical protein